MNRDSYSVIYDEEKEAHFTMQEFFKKYKDRLPQLVVVTEGNYGDTKFDDLASEQVMRIHTHSIQKRVLAREKDKPNRSSYITLPVNIPYHFKVVHSHKDDGKPEKLPDILKKSKLPIQVKFADRFTASSVDGIPDECLKGAPILLLKEYEETFYCVNYLTNGAMNTVPSLLALTTEITGTIVTGVKGKSKADFRNHLGAMTSAAATIKYDRTAGNPDVTRVTEAGTGTGNPLPELNPPFIEEFVPGPPPPLPPSRRRHDSDDGDTYEPPPDVGPRLPPRHPSTDKEEVQPEPSTPTPRYVPFPTTQQRAPLPPIPGADIVPESDDIYSQLTENATVESDTDSARASNENSFEVTERPWLNDLSIDDVSDVLRKLKLEKYVKKFKEDMVDGSILGDYDEDVLKEEYKFNKIEQIRLMKFVRKGHVPT